MAESKPTVTLKDGTKITLDDPSQIAQYSNREDLESITFGGDDDLPLADVKEAAATAPVPAALINASLSIDTATQQTVASVEQPKADPVVPKPAPAGDASTTITVTIGALAGAASSAGMPAITNLVKNVLKNKLKGKKTSDKVEDESEEPTDCKTHQIKANARFAKLSVRVSALEGKPVAEEKSSFSSSSSFEDLEERIEKIEKLLKQKGRKK